MNGRSNVPRRQSDSLDDSLPPHIEPARETPAAGEPVPVLDIHIERGLDIQLSTLPSYSAASSFINDCDTAPDAEGMDEALIDRGSQSRPLSHNDEASNAKSDNQPSMERPSRRRKSSLKGWRAGVAAAAATTTLAFLLNLSLTLWAVLHFGASDGIGDAYEGDCGVVNMWSTGLHLLINGLSSALFSASNYTMQCLAAPTRRECDAAHARGSWLDIGVPSVRNLFHIQRSRRVAWILLAFSSIPIHFLFNSAVFKELDNNINTYRQVFVSQEFLETETIDFDVFPKDHRPPANASAAARYVDKLLTWYSSPIASQLHAVYREDASSFDRLDPQECVKMYYRNEETILSGHSHLLVVMDVTPSHGNLDVVFPYSGYTSSGYNASAEYKLWPNWTDIGLSKAEADVMPHYW